MEAKFDHEKREQENLDAFEQWAWRKILSCTKIKSNIEFFQKVKSNIALEAFEKC